MGRSTLNITIKPMEQFFARRARLEPGKWAKSNADCTIAV
jgi:hypothetical protein